MLGCFTLGCFTLGCFAEVMSPLKDWELLSLKGSKNYIRKCGGIEGPPATLAPGHAAHAYPDP